MTESFSRKMFWTAAIFNWAVALILALRAPLLFELFSVTPVPSEALFLQLFAWLVFVFGIGYYWAASDPVANAPVIRLGILGKSSVVLVSIACVAAGVVSWQMLILASADAVYAVLFLRALKAAQGGSRNIPA